MSWNWSPSNRDWEEDFLLENGKYLCMCSCCKIVFMGYKRRYICKVCYVSNNRNNKIDSIIS
jgi:hypothetical protein